MASWSPNLKFAEHCSTVARVANAKLRTILIGFESRDRSFMINLFNTFVRPSLEFSCPVWNPSFLYEIDILEAVQRRFTRSFPDLRELPYPLRLSRLNIISLEERRLRADLLQVYKIVHGLDCLAFDDFFTWAPDVGTRGGGNKLFHNPRRVLVRKHFFCHRVVHPWNHLDRHYPHITGAPSIGSFRSNIQHANIHEFLRGRTLSPA